MRQLRSAFALPDENTVLVGGAEIHIDAFDLVALEAEEFGITETLAAPGHAFVGHKGRIAFDEDPFELMPFDPVGDAPAAHKVSGLVDLVVIGAGETETVCERVFNGLAVVRQISSEQGADDLRLALPRHVNLLTPAAAQRVQAGEKRERLPPRLTPR